MLNINSNNQINGKILFNLFLLLFVVACQEKEDSFRDIVEKNADREILNDFGEQWQPRIEG